MNLATWHWHIEISSKCTLKCTRCPRTEVPDTLVNTELHLEFFKRNFTEEFVKNNVERITFCGDDGDPIYAQDLIEVIKYFKKIKPISITIITNGSYKSKKWWVELGSVLDSNDQLHFSIDGYDQDTNVLYRVNSDFKSIMQGIKIIRRYSSCYMFWDLIIFKFNQDHIDKITNLARSLGFDFLQITKSSKFGSIDKRYNNDILEPRPENIAQSMLYEKSTICLSNKKMPENFLNKVKNLFHHLSENETITPLCFTGVKGLFINSQGDFFPCCWVANRYDQNSNWLQLGKKFNLYKENLQDVLHNILWQTKFYNNHSTCNHKCSKQRTLINSSFNF